MPSNISMLPDQAGEYDPLLYLKLVAEGAEERYLTGHSPLMMSIVITVDEDGTIRRFSSFADHERLLGILSLARRNAEDLLAQAYAAGFTDSP